MMKLADELKEIGKARALAAWPETTEMLSNLMRQRAQDGGWGALLVGVHSAEVEAMLTEWAGSQGLEIARASGPFTAAVWLSWGYKPAINTGFDAEVMPDGTLLIPEPKD